MDGPGGTVCEFHGRSDRTGYSPDHLRRDTHRPLFYLLSFVRPIILQKSCDVPLNFISRLELVFDDILSCVLIVNAN